MIAQLQLSGPIPGRHGRAPGKQANPGWKKVGPGSVVLFNLEKVGPQGALRRCMPAPPHEHRLFMLW